VQIVKDMEITGQRTKCTRIDIGWFGSFDFKTIYIEGFFGFGLKIKGGKSKDAWHHHDVCIETK
jgi:hypothetical protein